MAFSRCLCENLCVSVVKLSKKDSPQRHGERTETPRRSTAQNVAHPWAEL